MRPYLEKRKKEFDERIRELDASGNTDTPVLSSRCNLDLMVVCVMVFVICAIAYAEYNINIPLAILDIIKDALDPKIPQQHNNPSQWGIHNVTMMMMMCVCVMMFGCALGYRQHHDYCLAKKGNKQGFFLFNY